MKVATWAAAIVVAAGVAVLAAYWFVSVLDVLFDADDVPILIKIAVPAIVAGTVVLVLVAVLQRIRDRKDEDLEGGDGRKRHRRHAVHHSGHSLRRVRDTRLRHGGEDQPVGRVCGPTPKGPRYLGGVFGPPAGVDKIIS